MMSNNFEKQDVFSKNECGLAYQNPNCPYVTEINHNTNALCQVQQGLIALLGEDCTGLNSGIIRTILTDLGKLTDNMKVQRSWINTFRPIIIGVASAFLGSAITYLILMHG